MQGGRSKVQQKMQDGRAKAKQQKWKGNKAPKWTKPASGNKLRTQLIKPSRQLSQTEQN
jgi:hypothetical protein